VPWDPVVVCCGAVGEVIVTPPVDPHCGALDWNRLHVCQSSICSLPAIVDCHRLDSIFLPWCSFLNHHIMHESNHLLFKVKYLDTSSAQRAAAKPQSISVLAHCCHSHSAIVRARSSCPPHSVCFSVFGFFLPCVVRYGTFGSSVVIRYGCPE